MFGNHGLCGLPEEGAHEKSPKCPGGILGDFGGILQRSLPVTAGSDFFDKQSAIMTHFRMYSGLTKTSTALPRLSSKRTIL